MLKNDTELYLQSLRIANLSANTVKTYRQALEALMQFVGSEVDAREIDVNVMRAYIHVLAAKGLSPSTRNHALRVFKAFGKFLVDEGGLDENVFQLIPHAKAPARLIDPPTVKEVTRLLDGEIPTNWPARDWVELELLYGTGVRVQEAASITLDDLRTDGTILVHGKGGKERLVPIGKPLRLALAAYLPERKRVLRRRKQHSQALFFRCNAPSCTSHTCFAKLPPEPEPIDVRTIRRVLLTVCQAKGLEPMNPHSLRHACATHMLNNGAPLVVIKDLLGHAKLSTTAMYAFVSTGLMQKTYNAAHPSCQPAA
jgi:site-specific recombinase XerD